MATSDSRAVKPPRVMVLLATFNGRRWLPEQVASILDQLDVDVTLVALDDGSTDGTQDWLAEQNARDGRVLVLPSEEPTGRSASNFYRLIARSPVEQADYIAFSDQDDLWMPDKLARHVELMRSNGHDGISSNITAFSADGSRVLIKKNYPQREFDFLTESPGPGSTFLLTPRLFELVRDTLGSNVYAHEADYHDSLVYAITRARGWSWCIDSYSSVDYRQHEDNVLGANTGRASALARLHLIRSHWHRNQAIIHARVGLAVAPPDKRAGLEWILRLMTTPGIRSRLALAGAAANLRRRPRDRQVLRFLIAIGVW